VTATASIASAVLFVGFRDKLVICVYFVVPAIMITKLYAITILATFNNRPQAVGGPPPLPEAENSFEDAVHKKTFSRTFDRIVGTEVRIERNVIQHVWGDDLPGEHLEVSPLYCVYESRRLISLRS